MKFILAIISIGIMTFLLQSLGPWWTGAIVAGVIIAFASFKPGVAFAAGFVGVGLAWLFEALFINLGNDGILAGRIAEMLGGIPVFALFVITTVIGGLIGGLGGLTTTLGVRWWLAKK